MEVEDVYLCTLGSNMLFVRADLAYGSIWFNC